MSTVETGKHAEQCAVEFLVKLNFTILAVNFRCLYGEIDIIALHENRIHFIEVKTIAGAGKESLAVTVNKQKQKRISESAQFFMQVHREYNNCHAQFDVVTVADTIELIEQAFLEYS
ncbi:MAG TPA: YraN family protein [Spirochaetia bacterium]|nr:YraN family protein [Spirochaetales bacterium]HRS66566.1 YraN family protein [Spirochaetia bacterium]HPD79755.1 YraN family protein [Spirochaetales bacterium]HQG40990.1 YraN family protein [Spirochaetales bacterium]HQK34140.1 YraN family protein [Spirochaetales bacterium]